MLDLPEHYKVFVEHYGLIVLFITLFLETLGLPLPGETALIMTSALASDGGLNIVSVAAAGITAAMAGDNVAYLIGRRYGRGLVLTYGRRFGVTDENYRKAEQATEKYGAYIVVFARFFVVLRQLNGLVAGSANMSWPRFLLANLVGSTLWVLFWTTLVYQFGHTIALIPKALHHLSLIAAMSVPVLLILLVILYRRYGIDIRSRLPSPSSTSDEEKR
ncbi:DedA family protein [uncultured Roseibium sp.]|uniref:DedA family protein n=1 Tax=uncultured Roseibium sp. TaxID=1936171 RepID=UPI00261489AC|nr:DedA family protein [uncultured Roseibium sp.]